MMGTEIRFIVRAPSNQVVFTHIAQVDEPIIAAKIMERYGVLDKKIKQEAARHLLLNTLGAEHLNRYTVTFNEAKGEST